MVHSTFSDYDQRLRGFISSVNLTLARNEPGTHHKTDAPFNELALQLFELQFHRVAPYNQLCRSRGVSPHSIHHWRDIPALPVSAFKDFSVTPLPPDRRSLVFHSSGTTEHRPSRHFHNDASLALYEASLLPWFCTHLLPETQWAPATLNRTRRRVLSLTPSARDAAHSSLAYMFAAVARTFGSPNSQFAGKLTDDGAWALDCDCVVRFIDQARKVNQPVVILGTAFSFVQLLDDLAAIGADCLLPPGSLVLETGGYKGKSRALPKAELYDLITGRFGIPESHVISEYGMSELSSQAYDCVAGRAADRLFQFPPWARALVISPETGLPASAGETGLLRVVDLANVASVLSVQTEDLGRERGPGFELIGRAPCAGPRGCSLMIETD